MIYLAVTLVECLIDWMHFSRHMTVIGQGKDAKTTKIDVFGTKLILQQQQRLI